MTRYPPIPVKNSLPREPMKEEITEARRTNERWFLWCLMAMAALVALLPNLYALLAAPPGATYLGYQFNTDDHMVYSAWMRQAMDGHLLMDNRFATEAQPGLTIHLYFFLLGTIARVIGLAGAATLGRVGFSVLFVYLAYRLIQRLGDNRYQTKLALGLGVVGGGIGFVAWFWHNFGQMMVRPAPDAVKDLMMGRLPTDIWQPEGFVIPSMLTNGLFMVSLCLILFVFECLLQAREKWKSVLPGAIAFGLLMNIHSYDVLIVTLVMVAFMATEVYLKRATWAWVGRAVCIGLGAVLPALWFIHVFTLDPVFRERAATDTFSPNFRQLLVGYLPMVVLTFAGLIYEAHSSPKESGRRYAGIGLVATSYLFLFIASADHTQGYFMGFPAWIACFGAATVGAVLLADDEPFVNLLIAWAFVGMIAPYFPALFQRKLTMGLSIPWAILSAHGVAAMLRKQEVSSRNLATVLVCLVLSGTSIRWVLREIGYIRSNVAGTTRHRVYLSADVNHIVAYLNDLPGRKVVLVLPGAAYPVKDAQTGQDIPDEFNYPALPDLAPIITGLTGSYTYAGHWSETPHYNSKVGVMYSFFFSAPFMGVKKVMNPDERLAFIQESGATYAILPVHETYADLPIVSDHQLGAVVVPGTQFELVKLRH